METKYERVPFEVELAKKITNGECDGRIVTRDGRKARVVCWDAEGRDDYVLALLSNEKREYPVNFMPNGCMVKDEKTKSDLMLEIPQNITFKDGDIVSCGWKFENECCEWISIVKSVKYYDNRLHTKDYVIFVTKNNATIHDIIQFDTFSNSGEWIREATEEEKQILINKLKSSKNPKAKEYLKRFFDIEEKKEYEFKPFDKVLVSDDYKDSIWSCDFFSHKNEDGLYVCIGHIWENCIPYEGNEHLLGTTENY